MSAAGASLPAILARVTSATLLLVALLCLPALAQGEPQFFRIGSGVVDSPSFAVAGLVAAGLSSPPGGRPCDRGGSCGVPGTIALAQAIGSPAEAIDLLELRQLDAILIPASDAYRAATTKRPDAGKPRDQLRTVATLFIEGAHLIVRQGSRFETIQDLKRRTVAAATDDPAATAFLVQYVAQLGLDPKAVPLPISSALTRLADSRVDALIVVAVPPLPALVDLAYLIPIRLLAIPASAGGSPPYLSEMRLPAGTYPEVGEIDLPGLPSQLFVAAKTSADRVEAITRALWNESTQKLMAGGPPVARTVKLERALNGIAVPLHPGAARFYREAGLLNNTPIGE